MSVPIIPVQVNLPEKGNQPETYLDYLNTMNCSCVAGALVIPSPIPSGLFNMGDLLSDLLKFMGVFTSFYKIIAKILKIIGCIIEIFCALMNPFKTIAAVIRFFTICLPELLELFPQFAILLFIICIIKIILSIIVYILSVLIPLIEDIVVNITDLKNAIEEGNEDAYMAIAFKIISLFDELRSILALLALLSPIFEMIKALLVAIPIPCKGSDDEDPECPKVFNNMEYTGSDGNFIAIYGPDGPLDYNLYFTTESNQETFKKLSGFFPPGINYDEIESVDSAPYSLTIDDSEPFLVTKIDGNGKASLLPTATTLASDGYLSSVVMVDGYKQNIDPKYVRMGTPTGKFTQSSVGKYITMIDIRGGDTQNSGTWQIEEVYDGKNVKLSRGEDENDWVDIHNTLARQALLYPIPYIFWKQAPVFPTNGSNKNYVFTINHAELIRHNEISVGCHPAVKASIAAASNRFPDITDDIDLPPLPDVDSVILNVNAAVDKVVPKGSDTQYVLDNYLQIEETVGNIIPEISNILNAFQSECLDYIVHVFPKVFDPERSILDANPKIQLIGDPININIVAYDRSGDVLGKGLPPGLITAEAFTTEGTISTTEEVLGEDGSVIGKFEAVLNSDVPLKAQITAKVLGKDISDFNGNILIPRIIEVEFVEPSELARRRGYIDTSNEPLGIGRKG